MSKFSRHDPRNKKKGRHKELVINGHFDEAEVTRQQLRQSRRTVADPLLAQKSLDRMGLREEEDLS